MTDQELLLAIGKVVEAKMEPVRQDIHGLQEDVQALKSDFSRLETEVNRLEQRMGGLEGGTGTLEEQLTGVRIYMDTNLQRSLDLLLEGQRALWDRFISHEEFEPLEDRIEILELTVKRHSQEIRELQPA